MKGLIDFYRQLRARGEDRKAAILISRSGLFDPAYYLQTNLDVARAAVDPLHHYLHHGRREGRAPSPRFDPGFYLEANPDVSKAGIDPVIHYIRYGRAEGRSAQSPEQIIFSSGLFNPEYYLAAYLDVALSGQNPLRHYVKHGRKEGRRPSLDFDPAVYLARNQDLQRADIDPILHYILSGRAEGRRCRDSGLSSEDLPDAIAELRASGLFDEAFYLLQCPAVREAGIDPVLHYLVGGFSHHVDPSAAFSTIEYLETHPEVRSSASNPLLHELHSRPNSDDKHVAVAKERVSRPDDSIGIERAAGAVYFQRFQFSLKPADSPGKYVADAIADLVRRSPRLHVDTIEPDVSIIIPVYGQLHFALSCLESLSRQRGRFSVEIILADDASPEASQTTRLEEIPWIRYQRRESNSGFIDTCNDGARIARGKFLVFLNSDTRLAEGWLDELVGSFELFPKAGLVGSKLFNEDGTLQEAGGIYWRDGSAWNYGRNDDPNHPKYCFARQVDYVSGASIAVPAEIWRSMDGFDIKYRPAYCEDGDLAFRLREAGYEVWLQPLSCVIHYEGKTHGRDLAKGGKAYQEINMRRLAERWKSRLASHRQNGERPDQEANRAAQDRVLFIDALTPKPDRDAGSIFTYNILKALQTLGYQVTFLPQHSYVYDDAYTRDLQRLGIECLYRPFFYNIKDVLDFRDDFDIVFGCRINVLGEIHDEIRRRLPAARILFENADLHYLREEREAALYGSRSKKVRAAITKAAELELMAKADCTIVHTKVETEIIKQQIPVDNIIEIPAIYQLHPTQIPFEERHDVMFLGGFLHPPNIDSAKHFVKSIWPLLIHRLPERARFVIVGSSAPEEILSLASDRIIVTGFVADLQPYFDTARVFVAPLRYGAGIKGKVIQSLCHGTPAVMTSIAAEGIGLVSGREAIIADDDSEFAERVVMTYFNRSLWYSLQTAGYQFVESNYSWQRCLELLTKALDIADATWLVRHERALRERLDELTGEGKGVDDTAKAKGSHV